jgi:hypothetical protein
MASSDKGKDPHNLPTIRTTGILPSGAYPNALQGGGDTDPMSIDTSAFDEAEDTRAENQGFVPDVTEQHNMPPVQLDSAGFPTQRDVSSANLVDPDATAHGAALDRTNTDEADGPSAPGWSFGDWDNFWMRVHAIEAAGNDSDEALHKALRKHGLRDKSHFDEVRDQFQERFGDDPAFAQAALDARTRSTKMQMNARMQGELKGELAPVEGISLEQWAWVMAKIASGGNPAALLEIAKLDDATWQRVSAEWNARMSRDTTATIATAYGQAFVATGPGPFGEAGKQTAAAMLDPNKKGVDGGPPIPMESWIEITEAQNAASQRGEDAAAVLASYGMTPADWGVVGGWWGQHFNANAMKLIGEYNRLSEHYKRKFSR